MLDFGNINYDGFAQANMVMLEDLNKALEAGYGTDSDAFTGGRALIPESLDRTLVNVLHSQDEAKLFKQLKKVPVSSTVHEYTRRTEVGDEDGAWVAEGGNSFEKDQTLDRRTLPMKYLQTLRKVTLQMATAESIEDAMALEAEAGALWIVRQNERKLFSGNSQVVAEEPDGARKLIQSSNVIDMRGENANSTAFEDAMIRAARTARDGYGRLSQLYAPTPVCEDMQKLLRDRIRVNTGQGGDGTYVFTHYPTTYGRVKLDDNLFIAEGLTPQISTLTAQRPGKPVFTLAAVADVASKFVAGDAGNYYYVLVGESKYGQGEASDPVQINGVAIGDKVTLTVTTPSTNATGYRLYRSKVGGASGTEQFVRRVEGVTALPASIIDYNNDLPGTYDTFLFTMDAGYNALEWNQFLPMMKFQLYPTNAAVYPFLMLLFGALNIKKEEQAVRIKNVGYSGA